MQLGSAERISLPDLQGGYYALVTRSVDTRHHDQLPPATIHCHCWLLAQVIIVYTHYYVVQTCHSNVFLPKNMSKPCSSIFQIFAKGRLDQINFWLKCYLIILAYQNCLKSMYRYRFKNISHGHTERRKACKLNSSK